MEKLRSRSGASMILALLFFLLCTLVGASVLAAASSNAGKAAKRRMEQQEYFTVSSALRLVCDRLAKAEYRANASVTANEEVVTVTVKPVLADPSTHYTYTYKYKKTIYTQMQGSVEFDTPSTPSDGKWGAIFPQLQKELDYLFSTRFTGTECNGYHGNGKFVDDNVHVHSTLGSTDVSKPKEHKLKIKVNDAGLPDDALEELTKEVEVKVILDNPGALGEKKYWLFLEAKLLGGKGNFTVKAELKPTSSFPHINDPGTYNGPHPGLSNERGKLKWTLVRIYKEEG